MALISAGVGITPMIAMLNGQLVNNGRTRLHKPVHFIHAASDGERQAFALHLLQKAQLHSNLNLPIVYSAPSEGDELGRTHHSEGRVDRALLQRALRLDDYEVYLCAPTPFMQSVYDALLSLGVRDESIHFESFRPASIKRKIEAEGKEETGEGVALEFARSGKTAIWRPKSGTLLDLAQASGLQPLYSCRSGTCGTCATRLLKGRVDYPETPVYEVSDGDALIRVAHPHPGPRLEDGTLNRQGVTLDHEGERFSKSETATSYNRRNQ